MYVRARSTLPSQISKNLIGDKILNVFRDEADPSPSVSMYVEPGQHTGMLSAFLGEHTYILTNLGFTRDRNPIGQSIFLSVQSD